MIKLLGAFAAGEIDDTGAIHFRSRFFLKLSLSLLNVAVLLKTLGNVVIRPALREARDREGAQGGV